MSIEVLEKLLERKMNSLSGRKWANLKNQKSVEWYKATHKKADSPEVGINIGQPIGFI